MGPLPLVNQTRLCYDIDMSKRIFVIWCCCWLITYCVVPCYGVGRNKLIRAAIKVGRKKGLSSAQIERQIKNFYYREDFSYLNRRTDANKYSPATTPVPARKKIFTSIPQAILTEKAVVIADGKGTKKEQHSIVPSALTVLGSPAIKSAQERSIAYLRKQARMKDMSEYLPPDERERWRQEFEALRALWIKEPPSDVNDLPLYLTHEVPPETLTYLQQEYTKLTDLITQTQAQIMPKVIYSFLQNEGKRFDMSERRHINKTIFTVRSKISILLKALKKDPYLLVQQKYWDRMFCAFNPLLKGILIKPNFIFRQDNRQYSLTEFALHNPDGSTPYLPNSNSLIKGESSEEEDDDFDEEQYSGTLEAAKRQAARQVEQRQRRADMVRLAEQERDELLRHIPVGQRIAVINDDLLPLLNFEYWAKNGWLGKGAAVHTFRDGFSFLQEIHRGKRYDIVITDLIVPDGGVAMMETLRILDSNVVVFASSKFYPDDGDDHSSLDLFNFGMDGYMWYNSNLNEGSFGYLQYLRQLNNYYYYKNKHGWNR